MPLLRFLQFVAGGANSGFHLLEVDVLAVVFDDHALGSIRDIGLEHALGAMQDVLDHVGALAGVHAAHEITFLQVARRHLGTAYLGYGDHFFQSDLLGVVVQADFGNLLVAAHVSPRDAHFALE
jgi:hypothetical protein